MENLFQKYKIQFLIILVLLGILLRFAVTAFGHNFDMDSYQIIGEIMSRGGNVYAETSRYNYGPIWFNLLNIFYRFSLNFENQFDVFRISITAFLTLVDIGIFYVLFKKYTLKIALLFFLNPVSIIITGFHSQFDNLAVLIGMISVITYSYSTEIPVYKSKRKLFGLILLGIALMTKHLFFIFPLWLALKQKGLLSKVLVLIIPIAIFLLGFAPYWQDGSQGIINNVFLYKSFSNSPFWLFISPSFIKLIPMFILFIATLSISGIIFRKKNNLDSLFIYTACLVIFSPAIANQYLAIPLAFIAINFNWVFVIFTILSTLHLFVDEAGFNITNLYSIFPGKLLGYNSLITLLLIGFIWVYFRNKILSTGRRVYTFIIEEIKFQLRK